MANTNPSVASYYTGLLKERYARDILNLVPESVKIYKAVKYDQRAAEGEHYNVPVQLTSEQGFTYTAADTGSAVALNGARSLKMQRAQVKGTNLYLQASADLEQISKSSDKEKAFEQLTKVKLANMIKSFRKRLEAAMLYGQKGLGIISAKSNSSATVEVLTISAATFAPHMWVGAEGAGLVVYDSTTQISNTPGADQSDGTGVFTVTAVDIANRNITVSGVAADITALNALTIADNCVIYYQGSVTGSTSTFAHQDQLGLYNQLTDVTTTRFNISPSSYSLWAGSTYSAASAALNFSKIQSAIAQAVDRGLDEDVTVWVPHAAWNDILKDQAALRRIDASWNSKKVENGAKSIEFYGLCGSVTIEPSGFVKGGDAFVMPMETVIRVGSTDVGFRGNDGSEEQLFFPDPVYPGYLCRAYANQQVVATAPNKSVFISSIVSS